MGDKVGENPGALPAAGFFAILEKPEGGGAFKRVPSTWTSVSWSSIVWASSFGLVLYLV